MEKNKNMKWYMITVIPGRETDVVASLKHRVVAENMKDFFEEFKIMKGPIITQQQLENKLANKPFRYSNKNIFPGYIFTKMNITNEAWFLVRNTMYVTGLVGSTGNGTKPTPLSAIQLRKMERKVEQLKKDFKENKIKSFFTPGKIVEIIDGPTKGQIGPILENNDKRRIALIELVLFDRKTPTEIEYSKLRIKE